MVGAECYPQIMTLMKRTAMSLFAAVALVLGSQTFAAAKDITWGG